MRNVLFLRFVVLPLRGSTTSSSPRTTILISKTLSPSTKDNEPHSSVAHRRPRERYFQEAPETAGDFMWFGKEGMMMTGTNGSQLWDIAFVSQTIVESGLGAERSNRVSCVKALEWVGPDANQGQHYGFWERPPASKQGRLAFQYSSAELYCQRLYCGGIEGRAVPPGTSRVSDCKLTLLTVRSILTLLLTSPRS